MEIVQLLLAMAAVTGMWCLLAAAFLGLGLLICRIPAARPESPRDIAYLFWVGWSACVMLLQLWHLWLPVDWRALALVACLGLVGLLTGRQYLTHCAAALGATWKRRPWLLAIGLSTTILWANFAIGKIGSYDTGLYHLPAIRWNTAYPIVVGLGNLHGRLAFNNASLLYSSMLDVGPWTHRSSHLANGLPSLVVVLWLLWQVPSALRATNHGWCLSLFLGLLLPATLFWGHAHISSHNPDLLVFLMEVVVAALLLEIMLSSGCDTARRSFLLFAMTFISAVGIAVKLSFAPFGATACLVGLGFVVHRANWLAHWRVISRAATAATMLSLLVLGTWMLRGVYLSGYPVYPQTLGGVDVPWRIDPATVNEMREAIVAWACAPGVSSLEVLAERQWFLPWLASQFRDESKFTLPLVLAIAATAGTFLFQRLASRLTGSDLGGWRRSLGDAPAMSGRKPSGASLRLSHQPPTEIPDFLTPKRAVVLFRKWGRPVGMPLRYQLLLAPSLFTLLFTFATAPDVRFAGAAIWVFAAGAIALSLGRVSRRDRSFQFRWRMLVWPCILALPIVLFKMSHHMNGPGADHGFHPVPVAKMQPLVTDSGLRILVTTSGDQAWDAPLPNAPSVYYRADLRLRNEGNLGDGFVIRR